MSKSALNASRLNAFSMDPANVVIVGLDTKDGPEHPLYDARINLPLDEALILNIMANGVLQPILVRKDGDTAQCVVGRQRTRATREANVRRAAAGQPPLMIPVMSPIKADDAQLLAVMISENELRQADTYQVKAEKCQLLQAYGWDIPRIAMTFGCTGQAVKNWLAFFDMSPTVQKEIEAGAISASAARELTVLPRAEQDTALENLKLRAAAKLSKPAKPGEEAKAPKAVRHKDVVAAHREAAGKEAVPSRSLVAKILAHEDAGSLSEDVVRTLRWLSGDLSASKITGLTSILNSINAPKGAA